MNRFLFIIILVSSLFPSLIGRAKDSQSNTYEETGDSAFLHKSYDSAIYFYSKAFDGAQNSAILYYKIANTQYRLHHVGEAVWAYEKALLIQPGFSEAAENVALIQAQIHEKSAKNDLAFLNYWQQWSSPRRSNLWAVFALLFISIPIIIISLARFFKIETPWLKFQYILTIELTGILMGAIALWSAIHNKPNDIGVIINPSVKMQSTQKNLSINASKTLPEGLVVNIVGSKNNQINILLSDNSEGLIQISDVKLVK